ncbi:MAG: dephospho-CoA kinase [Tissierellia bacterium]|nr:dephospho-CoA kinase [Tissierellia bacterium]MDD4725179.1 dephospho-CoA kinase [Tissierellia bacterium]
MTLNNCTIIGITGGIASGKSTLTNMLRKKGYIVIDADSISRDVTKIGKPSYYEIIEHFGYEILLEDKSIDRKLLGKLIFENLQLREELNGIVHSRVFEELQLLINKYCNDNEIIFIDIPLLFETIEVAKSFGLIFDEIWVVYVDNDIQLKRLMSRDDITKEEALLKIKSQMSLDEKAKIANRVLYNNGKLNELENDLEQILSKLR